MKFSTVYIGFLNHCSSHAPLNITVKLSQYTHSYVIVVSSSVARGGAGGARAPPIGLWSMQNRMFFVLLRPIFWEKEKIAPPIRKQPPLRRLNLRNWTKNQSRYRCRPFFFLFFFFFWRSPDFFGRKKPLNFGFRPKNHSQFWWRPFFFFGDHLILGGKNLWIYELSEKFRLNFRTIRLKLLLDQWKFQSRSFAHFSVFQNSPPPFSKSWLRAWLWVVFFTVWFILFHILTSKHYHYKLPQKY